jgi:hypothetical protein
VVGGEPVTFRMKAMLATEIYSPILGFYIKDKLVKFCLATILI